MMFESGGGDQEMQSKVGAHYNLPMVSVRDALWPDIAAGRIRWHDYFVDNVHPNDAGHAFAARCVTALLEASGTAEAPHGRDPLDPLPAPLHSDAFQFVEWRDDAALTPARNDGWTLGPRRQWKVSVGGNVGERPHRFRLVRHRHRRAARPAAR